MKCQLPAAHRPFGTNAVDSIVVVEHQAVVVIRARIRHERDRDVRVVPVVMRRSLAPARTSQSVSPLTIRNVSASRSGSARRGPPADPRIGCSQEYRTRIPRCAPSPTTTRDRLRPMVQVEHDVADALRAYSQSSDALDERPPAERHGRLGDESGQRIETRAETGREDEGGKHDGDCKGELELQELATPRTTSTPIRNCHRRVSACERATSALAGRCASTTTRARCGRRRPCRGARRTSSTVVADWPFTLRITSPGGGPPAPPGRRRLDVAHDDAAAAVRQLAAVARGRGVMRLDRHAEARVLGCSSASRGVAPTPDAWSPCSAFEIELVDLDVERHRLSCRGRPSSAPSCPASSG